MAQPATRCDPNTTKQTIQIAKTVELKHESILKWWPEALGWTTSVLITAAIVVLLHAYEGETSARWQSQVPITLNAALSLLVTFLYMALMVPIPKCIAQLKWNHYTMSRPLSDVELFDEASRTVWGSAVLLVTRPNRFIAGLGAFLTLAVAGVGPFVQQILSQEVEPRQLDGIKPTIPIFNWTSPYSGVTQMAINPTDFENFSFWQAKTNNDAFDAALYAGLIAPVARDFPLDPSCAGANCTWSPYWTLALESQCSNMTDKLAWSTDKWSLPNGLDVETIGRGNSKTFYGLTTKYPSIAFQDRGHLLSDFFITASGNRWEGEQSFPTAAAMECILQFRARRVKAEYKKGVFSETQLGPSLSVNTLEARGCSPWRRSLASSEFDIPNVVDQTGETFFNRSTGDDPLAAQWFSGGDPLEPVTSTCNVTIPVNSSIPDGNLVFPAFHLVKAAWRMIYLLEIQNGSLSRSGDFSGGILTYLVGSVSEDPSSQGTLDASRNITVAERVDNIAKSLTTAMRSTYFENSVLVPGGAYQDTVIYTVAWYWVIVPASLVLLTLVLLILTAWDTAHKGLEKRVDSSLALMVFGCGQDVRDSLTLAGDLAAVTKIAKGTRVRLGPGHVLTLAGEPQSKG